MVKIIGRGASNYSKDSSNKVTLTETLQVEGNTLAEIAQSNLLPAINDAYPGFSNVVLDNIEIEPNGNLGRKVQALVTLTYSTVDSASGSDSEGEASLVGVTSVNISYNEYTQPMTYAYRPYASSPAYELKNTAGCRIEAEKTSLIMQININYRDKEMPPMSYSPQINSKEEEVMGVKIPAFGGKLLPPSISYVRENGDNYYDCTASIQVHPETWIITFLNVGTMCKWKTSENKITPTPSNIYRYTPWNSTDISENMKIASQYGSIDDVIAAQKKYWDITGDKTDKIPYEEVTEPMPLDYDGTLFLSALDGELIDDDKAVLHDTVAYLKYRYLDCRPVSDWGEWVPKTLEWKGYKPPKGK